MIGALLQRVLPMPLLLRAYRLFRYGPLDVLDWVRGRRDPLIPGRFRIFIGGNAYREVGDEFLRHFQRFGGVTPRSRVLDVGCGIGRMSRPFTAFLDPAVGRYEGFDVDLAGVEWCRRHYAGLPHFRFQHANIRNAFYNPGGDVDAEAYTFPYEAGSFDLVFATSVFTHLSIGATRRYLGEIARVLAPGGRAVLTLFLWNQEAMALVAEGRSSLPMVEHDGLVVLNPRIVEEAIAIRQSDWSAALRAAGLEPEGDPHLGWWCGRSGGVTFQDVAVVRRAGRQVQPA